MRRWPMTLWLLYASCKSSGAMAGSRCSYTRIPRTGRVLVSTSKIAMGAMNLSRRNSLRSPCGCTASRDRSGGLPLGHPCDLHPRLCHPSLLAHNLESVSFQISTVTTYFVSFLFCDDTYTDLYRSSTGSEDKRILPFSLTSLLSRSFVVQHLTPSCLQVYLRHHLIYATVSSRFALAQMTTTNSDLF